jgi:hypothetical protein
LEVDMVRLQPSRSAFCAQKAAEALQRAELAVTPYDFDLWFSLAIKWRGLAEWYDGFHETDGPQGSRTRLH